MATETRKLNPNQTDRLKFRSIFDLPPNLFDSCRLLKDGTSSTFQSDPDEISPNAIDERTLIQEEDNKVKKFVPRLSCNTCKAEFESLEDQRSHFKSDHHRFNVKLNIAGKDIIKEEDFDELASDSLFEDCDISSISGSEDETEKSSLSSSEVHRRTELKRKLFVRLHTGEVVSLWKCLLFNETETLLFDNDKSDSEYNGGGTLYLKENELVERLRSLVHETRDKTQLRIVLLASGGHFAGCVFDGNSVVAHKTFHRYVIRAKAGKKQSTKDASGRTVHSAGASLRRYNELALKKDVQELFANWKPYFDVSSCIFINAPSSSRQLLFSGEKPYFSDPRHVVKQIPVPVRRPTFKEAKRIYDQLTNMVYEVEEKGSSETLKEYSPSCTSNAGKDLKSNEEKVEQVDHLDRKEISEPCQVNENSDGLSESIGDEFIGVTTPLHVAATSSNAQQTLELLEQGLDPCVKDERGRTPYMLASDKEVRNTFRRFMALNLDKWDWHAAKVPSPLTKEMEESQAAKQAEKDAKRKAKAKELKKLRKAKEKKAEAEAALSQSALTMAQGKAAVPTSVPKQLLQSIRAQSLSKEEEAKRAQAVEREKRAAAAEKRFAAAAALSAQGTSQTVPPTNPTSSNGTSDGIYCSCCNSSLAGKIPFHRYNYKYCSTSCMHVHREMLEDG